MLTIAEFRRIDFGPDLKAELDRAVIRMMAGDDRDYARVQTSILAYLRVALRGSGCRPYGSETQLRSADLSLRYLDVSVDGGTPDDAGGDTVLRAPCVLVEVLSPLHPRHPKGQARRIPVDRDGRHNRAGRPPYRLAARPPAHGAARVGRCQLFLAGAARPADARRQHPHEEMFARN